MNNNNQAATKADVKKVENKVDKLEGRFDKLEGRFDKLEGRVDKLEVKVDKLTIEVIDIKEKMGDMATKDDLVKFKDEILDAVVITRKIAEISDTERAANLGAHKRIQTDVNEVRTHIGMKIKHPQVNDGK